MKKIALGLAIAGMLVACEKSIPRTESPEPQTIQSIMAAGPVDYIVTCQGHCSGGSTACETLKSTTEKTYKCSCQSEYCYMVVELFYGGVQTPGAVLIGAEAENCIQVVLKGKETFQRHLDVHMQDLYMHVDYTITQVRYSVRDRGFGVHYTCQVNTGNALVQETVLFVDFPEDGKKVKVSCNGHCDTSTQLCVEEFGFGAQSINCSCQSNNCYMVIEDLSPSAEQ